MLAPFTKEFYKQKNVELNKNSTKLIFQRNKHEIN